MLTWLWGRVGLRYIGVVVAIVTFLALYQHFGASHAPGSPGFSKALGLSSPPQSKTTDGDYAEFKKVNKITYIPSSYDWGKAKVFHPVQDVKPLPKGKPTKFPAVQTKSSSKAKQDDSSKTRAQEIKEKFVKSWEAYKTHAWTLDELKPLSGRGKQSLSGWSAQIIDALDTLWIMDLKEDFHLGVMEAAKIDWAETTDIKINLFEVTIRYLGGLLAAYDLSGEEVLLKKAIELGDALYATFDTPNRLPSHWLVYMAAKNGMQTADEDMSSAAGGSLSMEFTRLSQITGDPKYYDATERIKQFFARLQDTTRIPGLWPKGLNYKDEFVYDGFYSLGAGADSHVEYLPKMHALLGGLDPEYAEMTVKALEAARDNLMFKPMNREDKNLLLVGNGTPENGVTHLHTELQHLSCFIGGTYGLAGRLLSRDDFVDLGSRLTDGCVWAYDSFKTNIMPEVSEVVGCAGKNDSCPFESSAVPSFGVDSLPDGFKSARDTRYLLRPEAIESVFYMWRITGDQYWRDAAWRMWEAIVRECETETAFAAIEDVTAHNSAKVDSMETFWLGETVKYFYLIFTDAKVLDLDEWVFNTEAHPLKRHLPS